MVSIKRNGQALGVRMLIDRIFDADQSALVVVSGDFNAEEREVPLRILIADPEDTGNGRLASRSLVLLEHGLADSKRYTVIYGGHRQMLDHFLVSRPMRAHFRSMEVHNEALGDELVAHAIVDASAESYHAPIVAEFDFAEENQPPERG